MRTTHLYAFAAPRHDHQLYIAPRPLPGRLIGTAAGMVHDVAPDYVQEAKRLDAHPITLITPAGLERLAEQLLTADGRYSRADYEEAGVWDADMITRDRGHAVITITPTPDAGDLIDATDDPAPVCLAAHYTATGDTCAHSGADRPGDADPAHPCPDRCLAAQLDNDAAGGVSTRGWSAHNG